MGVDLLCDYGCPSQANAASESRGPVVEKRTIFGVPVIGYNLGEGGFAISSRRTLDHHVSASDEGRLGGGLSRHVAEQLLDLGLDPMSVARKIDPDQRRYFVEGVLRPAEQG